MSPLPKSAILARLTRFLSRRSMPTALRDSQQAQDDEIAAIVGLIAKFAPQRPEDLAAWWTNFEADLGQRNTTRSWPSEGEIAASCKAVSSAPTHRLAEGTEIDANAINARRIKAGDPVGEFWVYGTMAAELLQSRAVTDADLRPYRSSLFFNDREVYGEEEARRMEGERLNRHAEAMRRVGGQAQRPMPIPDKRYVEADDE